jgi:pSer/pThr/pTyr-binding forkhead associated (FHA) protein
MTASPAMLNVLPSDARTEQFDPVSCFNSRERNRAKAIGPSAPGRYIRIQGPTQELLIPLSDEALHIGRGLAADIRLDHTSVSRRHAILIPRGPRARILDDRSLNGTFVNGQRVEHADLHDDDLIVIGRFQLRYVEA